MLRKQKLKKGDKVWLQGKHWTVWDVTPNGCFFDEYVLRIDNIYQVHYERILLPTEYPEHSCN